MSATMELVLPKNYIEIEQDEMMYLDGGWTSTRTETATQARNRFRNVASLAQVGQVLSVIKIGVSAAMKNVVGGIVGTLLGTWFTNVRSHSGDAQVAAQNIINRNGANRRVTWTSNWTWLGSLSGISIRLA